MFGLPAAVLVQFPDFKPLIAVEIGPQRRTLTLLQFQTSPPLLRQRKKHLERKNKPPLTCGVKGKTGKGKRPAMRRLKDFLVRLLHFPENIIPSITSFAAQM
jgi:hypothetical protein